MDRFLIASIPPTLASKKKPEKHTIHPTANETLVGSSRATCVSMTFPLVMKVGEDAGDSGAEEDKDNDENDENDEGKSSSRIESGVCVCEFD